MSLHPAQVLFAGEKPFPALPAVDHYAGAEKLMMKALKLQQELGPVFDITCDCEDGARAGAEAEHAQMVVEVVNGAENHFS
ncbi:MAG: CoA ester lyase, partial [Thauera sp.]